MGYTKDDIKKVKSQENELYKLKRYIERRLKKIKFKQRLRLERGHFSSDANDFSSYNLDDRLNRAAFDAYGDCKKIYEAISKLSKKRY